MFKPYSLMFLLAIVSLPTTILTADDMQVDGVDESPAGFMARLRQVEAASDIDEKGEFNLQRIYDANPGCQRFSDSSYVMDKFPDYLEYFCTLAASTKLTDEQKFKKEFVLIPYFKKLACQSEAIQDRELSLMGRDMVDLTCYASYTYTRLFLAALSYVTHNINACIDLPDSQHTTYMVSANPLIISLSSRDVNLTKFLLEHGVDPNAGSPLKSCTTLEQARLLLEGGADICEQLKQGDLISHAIGRVSDPSILHYLLQHVRLNVANDFGKPWLYHLVQSTPFLNLDNFSKKLNILFDTGCLYDEDRILDSLNHGSLLYTCHPQEKREKVISAFIQAFEQDKKKQRKNIVLALRERQITGERLQPSQTNLRSYYERALEIYKKQQKK